MTNVVNPPWQMTPAEIVLTLRHCVVRRIEVKAIRVDDRLLQWISESCRLIYSTETHRLYLPGMIALLKPKPDSTPWFSNDLTSLKVRRGLGL
jgi:hypothetical protein